MSYFETFSKRQKRLQNAGKQDVYQYDTLPIPLRVQVVHIWRDGIGVFSDRDYLHPSPTNGIWQFIHDTMCREMGMFKLTPNPEDPKADCEKYLLGASTEGALDIIELSFRMMERIVPKLGPGDLEDAKIEITPSEAVEELNRRFREHGFGYQYLDGEIIRVDSQFVHAEVVKPALALLNAFGFDGPSEEFLRAFEHYRHGRNKEAVAEALKSFESTMKAICAARKWSFPANATAKPLIDILLRNGLIPQNLESHFTGLRSALESGLPTLSNSTSRHGQGASPIQVPQFFVGYALHLLASNIVFLVEAHKALP